MAYDKYTQQDVIDVLEKYPRQARKFLNDISQWENEVEEVINQRFPDWDDFEDEVMKIFMLGRYSGGYESIEITQDFQVPGTDIILEKGDKIKIQESITSIDVDLAIRLGEMDDYLLSTKRKYKIVGTVIDEAGPGGGWPIVQFKGNEDQLLNWYINEYGGYEDDFYEFYG